MLPSPIEMIELKYFTRGEAMSRRFILPGYKLHLKLQSTVCPVGRGIVISPAFQPNWYSMSIMHFIQSCVPILDVNCGVLKNFVLCILSFSLLHKGLLKWLYISFMWLTGTANETVRLLFVVLRDHANPLREVSTVL